LRPTLISQFKYLYKECKTKYYIVATTSETSIHAHKATNFISEYIHQFRYKVKNQKYNYIFMKMQLFHFQFKDKS
jgi:hypothetical protein